MLYSIVGYSLIIGIIWNYIAQFLRIFINQIQWDVEFIFLVARVCR